MQNPEMKKKAMDFIGNFVKTANQSVDKAKENTGTNIAKSVVDAVTNSSKETDSDRGSGK